MSPEAGPFRVLQTLPSTGTINNDGISNTVSIDCTTLAPTPINFQDVLRNSSSGTWDRLPIDPMQYTSHKTPATLPNLIYRICNKAENEQREGNHWKGNTLRESNAKDRDAKGTYYRIEITARNATALHHTALSVTAFNIGAGLSTGRNAKITKGQ